MIRKYGKAVKYEVIPNPNNPKSEYQKVEAVKKSVLTPSCLCSSIITSVLILTYYIPSIGLTFYQHWLFKSFRYPLFTVQIHFILKYGIAAAIRCCFSPKNEEKQFALGWREYVIFFGAAGICSGIDVGFSNFGLELITISLYTMTKSTVVIFILIFAILFKLEKKSWSLSFTVLMISSGLMLFTYKATQFNFGGFILVLFASISSGIRWTVVQIVMQRYQIGVRNLIDVIYHMQPWMILSLLPFTLWIEGPMFIKSCQLFRVDDFNILTQTWLKIIFGGLIAFFMEICEVLLVTYTSSLTLSIAGIFKEIVILGLAIVWEGDEMGPVNIVGLILCLLGIITHVIQKIRNPPKIIPRHVNAYDKYELEESLLEEDEIHDFASDNSDAEKSDSQEIFDIINRHDR